MPNDEKYFDETQLMLDSFFCDLILEEPQAETKVSKWWDKLPTAVRHQIVAIWSGRLNRAEGDIVYKDKTTGKPKKTTGTSSAVAIAQAALVKNKYIKSNAKLFHWKDHMFTKKGVEWNSLREQGKKKVGGKEVVIPAIKINKREMQWKQFVRIAKSKSKEE